MITDCLLPKPWWTLRGPKFDIIPNQRALAYHSVFRLKFIPLLYVPVFYKSLEEEPRKSGFLTPNVGNSSRRGKMIGAGYFWAMNRSYDATYQAQYFTQRGFAHNVSFRGKPAARSEFNFSLYGANDRGVRQSNGERIKEGGFSFLLDGKFDLRDGWHAQVEGSYLSSMRFRQAFTESFNEAIVSEVHSTGFVGRHWSSFGLNLVMARLENIQKTGDLNPVTRQYNPDDKISIRKLPSLELVSRDRRIWKRLPVWFSLDSSAALVGRSQPSFETRQFVDRLDLRPKLTTAFRWKGFSLLPGFSFRATQYGSSQVHGLVSGANIFRRQREFTLEFVPPSLARTFKAPRWMGEKVKHVIEPRASFRYASGIDNFSEIIRFDEVDLASNTNEAEISLTNRLYVKRGSDVNEVLTWRVAQRRYFDPGFGGAVTAANQASGLLQRNVLLSSIELTSFAFLDGPRNYSPVVSVLRVSPVAGFSMEYRADYDPLRQKLMDGGLNADWRRQFLFISVGHNHVRSLSQLSPSANQIRGTMGWGNDNRRGWNVAFNAVYDLRLSAMQYATTQVTYNTDCCGFIVQYRRFSVGARNENQYRFGISIANIGAFGTLKKQERLF